MIYCFDLDGTLCEHRKDGRYHLAQPMWNRIAEVNRLAYAGHYIIIDTARGSKTGIDWRRATQRQLDGWHVRYDELYVGRKPYATCYVDDRGIDADIFFGGETT